MLQTSKVKLFFYIFLFIVTTAVTQNALAGDWCDETLSFITSDQYNRSDLSQINKLFEKINLKSTNECKDKLKLSLIYVSIADGYRLIEQHFDRQMLFYKKTLLIKNIPDEIYIHSATAIAYIYLNGRTGKPDKKKSIDYFELAMRKGGVLATGYIGFSLYEGINGLKANTEEGFSLMKKSADNGYYAIGFFVSRAYISGVGTLRNDTKAYQYMKASAENGNISAYELLSAMYYMGKGTKVNKVYAYAWATINLKYNKEDQNNNLMRLNIISSELSQEEIEKAQNLSIELDGIIKSNSKLDELKGYY